MNNYDKMHRKEPNTPLDNAEKQTVQKVPKKTSKKVKLIVCSVFLVISLALLLILFDVFGKSAANALYGVFGVAAIGYAIIIALVSVLLMIGLKPKRMSKRNTVYLIVLCLLVVLFLQIITSVNIFKKLGDDNGYSAYLSACFTFGRSNAGGALFGILAYPFLRWLGSVTSLTIIAVAFFGILFLYFRSFFFEVQENKILPEEPESSDMYVEELVDRKKGKSPDKIDLSFPNDEPQEEEYDEPEAKYAGDVQYSRLLDENRDEEELRRFAQKTLFDDDFVPNKKENQTNDTPLKTGKRTSEKYNFGDGITNKELYDANRFEKFLKGDERTKAEDILFNDRPDNAQPERKKPTGKAEIEAILFGDEIPSEYDFNYTTPKDVKPLDPLSNAPSSFVQRSAQPSSNFVQRPVTNQNESDVIDYSSAITQKDKNGLLDMDNKDDLYYEEPNVQDNNSFAYGQQNAYNAYQKDNSESAFVITTDKDDNNESTLFDEKENETYRQSPINNGYDRQNGIEENINSSYDHVITQEQASMIKPFENPVMEDYQGEDAKQSEVKPYYEKADFDPLPEVKPYYAVKEENKVQNDEKSEQYDGNGYTPNYQNKPDFSTQTTPEEQLFGTTFGQRENDVRDQEELKRLARETLFGDVKTQTVEREDKPSYDLSVEDDKEEQEEWEEAEEFKYQPFPVRNDEGSAPSDTPKFTGFVRREIETKPQPAVPTQQPAVSTQQPVVKAQPVAKPKPEKRPYTAPPISLLRDYPPPNAYFDYEGMYRRIEDAFRSYNIGCTVLGHTKGPTFTQYAVNLEDGVHFSKVLTLDKDMKRKLQLESPVNFVESVKGMDAIGLEIANETRAKVELKQFINNSCFRKEKKLYFILGVNIYGEPYFVDILDAPHMLIAGTTGSGKSICINTILTSIIYNYSPDYVKLLLVDPKSVELSNFNEIPHNMLGRSIVDCPTCIRALDYIIEEMERRYSIMNEAQYKQLKNYNDYLISIGSKPLPYIVVMIDEFADLMMHSKKTAPELDKRIKVLTAKSRAAGIHLILATQRPSIDVITGVIKNNISTRICFTMGDAIGSKVVIDRGGAEKLYGKGDLLFLDRNNQTPVRLQAPFLDDDEVVEITDNIKRNNDMDIDEQFYKYLFDVKTPEFNTVVTKADGGQQAPADGNVDENGLDVMFWECAEFAANEGVLSISKLQRRYHLGFQRAGSIVDEMERRGFIEAAIPGSSRPRRVMISPEDLDYLKNADDEEE